MRKRRRYLWLAEPRRYRPTHRRDQGRPMDFFERHFIDSNVGMYALYGAGIIAVALTLAFIIASTPWTRL